MEHKYSIPKEKIAQLESLLCEYDIDALLIVSREGSDQVLPFLIGEDSIHLAAAFFTKTGQHVMLCSPSDEKKYEESGIFSAIKVYEKSLGELLAKTLDEVSPKNLALNISKDDSGADGLSYGLYLLIQDLVGKERLAEIEVSSEMIIRELRSIKTTTEIERLRRAISITNDIFDEIFSSEIKCGMTEKEIADLFINGLKRHGVTSGIGGSYDYPIVCIVRAGLAHRGPGDTASIPGDIVIIDFSVRCEGYVSDIARTAYFLIEGESEPPEDVQHAFQTAYDAITAAIEFIAVGKRGWEVDAVGRKVIEDGGYPTIRHSVGHPIGTQCHDSGTRLGPFKGENESSNRPIKPFEVYAIEPTVIQDDGLPCMLVEENVLVLPHGKEILSRRQEELYLIPYSK